MKNNLAKLLAVSSLVAGGTIMAAMPANAIQIDLTDTTDGNEGFLNIGTYGAKFTGEPIPDPDNPGDFLNTDGGIITKVEFDDDPSFVEDFIAPIDFATADINSTNLSDIIDNFDTNIGVAQIRSLDLLDTDFFVPTFPIDSSFAGGIQNEFTVLPAFGNFIEIDNLTADPESPDLAIVLNSFSTFQSASLLDGDAVIGVGFEGLVDFVTFGPDGQEVHLGSGSFSTTFPSNGTNMVEGTAVLSFEVEAKVPESSNLVPLIGLGLLGSALALKKKSKVA